MPGLPRSAAAAKKMTEDGLREQAQQGIDATRLKNQLPSRTLPPATATARGGVTLSDDDPAADGTAASGTSGSASRADHVHPASGAGLTIEELDGSPSESAPTKLIFPNGTLSVVSHEVTYTPAGGGGSAAQTYLGKTSTGASSEAMNRLQVYAKKITLGSAGFVLSVGARVRATTHDKVVDFVAALWQDNAGAIGTLLSANAPTGVQNLLLSNGSVSAFRYLELPIGIYLAPGDYWIGVQFANAGSGASLDIGYDSGGADHVYTPGGGWIADGGYYSATDSTKAYDIRANVLTI